MTAHGSMVEGYLSGIRTGTCGMESEGGAAHRRPYQAALQRGQAMRLFLSFLLSLQKL